MNIESLRTHCKQECQRLFPEFYEKKRKKTVIFLTDLFNSLHGRYLVPLFVILAFTVGMFIHPTILQVIKIDDTTAKTILDQRITNLAALFSITLVIAGWLITNVALKEPVSYKLLFKVSNLYPIFYYVISLIAVLIMFSLLRNSFGIDIKAVTVTGTYLIIIALLLITLLFIQLIKVVNPQFIFSILEKELLREVTILSKEMALEELWRKQYDAFFERLGFSNNFNLFTDLSQYRSININRHNAKNNNEVLNIDSFFPKNTHRIADVNLSKLSGSVWKNINGKKYYRQIGLNTSISSNSPVLHILKQQPVSKKEELRLVSAFIIKRIKEKKEPSRSELSEYLKKKLDKSIKEGNQEMTNNILAIYSRLYEFEDILFQRLVP